MRWRSNSSVGEGGISIPPSLGGPPIFGSLWFETVELSPSVLELLLLRGHKPKKERDLLAGRKRSQIPSRRYGSKQGKEDGWNNKIVGSAS